MTSDHAPCPICDVALLGESEPTRARRFYVAMRRAQIERDKAQAAIARVRALALSPHVVPIQTIEGVENAPVVWPHAILNALDQGGTDA